MPIPFGYNKMGITFGKYRHCMLVKKVSSKHSMVIFRPCLALVLEKFENSMVA